MDVLHTTRAVSAPIGDAAAAFYWAPTAAARAEGIGLDVFLLYAGGRGGVLGDLTSVQVEEEFFFFKPGMISLMVEAARAGAAPADILGAHLGAADDYARATFGAIDPDVVAGFDDAAGHVVDGFPSGRWALADGYRSTTVPDDPLASAYRRAIVLRELRGMVHRDAVVAAGLTPAVSCQTGALESYALHGFGDEDRVELTTAILAARATADEATDAGMAELLTVLDDARRVALVAGAEALVAATADPVPAG